MLSVPRQIVPQKVKYIKIQVFINMKGKDQGIVMRVMRFKGEKNLIHMQLQLMRVRRDLSQRELAAQMQILGTNIDQQAISSIENNKRVVTDFELACFCKALCCTESELLQTSERIDDHEECSLIL